MVSKSKTNKQISQLELCENLFRTSFARTSWFLVKVHIKANRCRITPFEHFWTLKWRNKPQNQNLREQLGKTGPSWKFWLSVRICAKVNFLEFGRFAQFPNLEQRNGFQNWNVHEKLSGTSPFWKFWLFGQSQRFTCSKHFLSSSFFCRRFGPGQVNGSNQVGLDKQVRP